MDLQLHQGKELGFPQSTLSPSNLPFLPALAHATNTDHAKTKSVPLREYVVYVGWQFN